MEHTEGRNLQIVFVLQYYSHRFVIRKEFSILHNNGNIFQKYIVDAYVKVKGMLNQCK